MFCWILRPLPARPTPYIQMVPNNALHSTPPRRPSAPGRCFQTWWPGPGVDDQLDIAEQREIQLGTQKISTTSVTKSWFWQKELRFNPHGLGLCPKLSYTDIIPELPLS